MTIRNIIFDLGGVLLNIDYHASIRAFKALGVSDFDKFFTQAAQVHLFDHLDRGQISPQDFRHSLRELSGLALQDEQIDDAWNAMLLDMPPGRIRLLEGVRQQYNIFLLSNTNAIHYPRYMQYMHETFGYESLEQIFSKQYLSHEIGLRKPDAEAYELILKENGLQAQETLFIDDTLGHVQGAASVGINALWLNLEEMEVMDLFTPEHRLREDVKTLLHRLQ